MIVQTEMPEAALLDAIRTAESLPGEGVTVEELCVAIGRGDKYVRKLVRSALENNTLRRTRRQKMSLDGRMLMTPTYAVVE